MIETPRAALRAGEIAEVADFFSFGTNDLTQMTFGFSRDDVGPHPRALPRARLLPVDPFETLDVDGVGELVRLAVERGPRDPARSSRSACAASTAATPTSIAFFRDGRARLRLVLAVPGAGRPAGRRPAVLGDLPPRLRRRAASG